jgi:RNA polymerase sigma-70 factor (ECF subfamily)
MTTTAMTTTDPFLEYRPLLFSIAYRMLGSAADAEDAVQETYLRWHKTRQTGEEIQNPKGWLTTTISRVCLDQLGSARAKREQYVGPWLPEPLAGTSPDIAETVSDFDSLSVAFLVLLESLSPKERAVFLLHDVFGYDFAAVGEIVGESDAYCRQLAKRARAHMSDRRPRFTSSPEQRELLANRFMHAVAEGDMPGLIETLTADATVFSDGGGKIFAARKPVVGRDKVATFLTRVARPGLEQSTFSFQVINGQPGALLLIDGMLKSVMTFDFTDEGIRSIYVILNPDKLRPIAESLSLTIAPVNLPVLPDRLVRKEKASE